MKEIGAVIAVTLMFLAFIVWGCAQLDKTSCASRAQSMGFPYSWGMLQQCMIHVRGQWIPIESYKVLQ
jgi:hypothetical protein